MFEPLNNGQHPPYFSTKLIWFTCSQHQVKTMEEAKLWRKSKKNEYILTLSLSLKKKIIQSDRTHTRKTDQQVCTEIKFYKQKKNENSPVISCLHAIYFYLDCATQKWYSTAAAWKEENVLHSSTFDEVVERSRNKV